MVTSADKFTRGEENQVIQVDEMKVQVPDFTENLTQLERDLFHFFTSLTQEKNHAHRFHFYTSLKLKVNYACRFHFYTSLKLKVNYACRHLIHFLTSLTQKGNYAHIIRFIF